MSADLARKRRRFSVYDLAVDPYRKTRSADVTAAYNPDCSIIGYKHNFFDWAEEPHTQYIPNFVGCVVADANLDSILGTLWLIISGKLGIYGFRRKLQKLSPSSI